MIYILNAKCMRLALGLGEWPCATNTMYVVSCTSHSLIKCIGECLHELCVSYINVLNAKCIGECDSTNCGEWFCYHYHQYQITKFWD